MDADFSENKTAGKYLKVFYLLFYTSLNMKDIDRLKSSELRIFSALVQREVSRKYKFYESWFKQMCKSLGAKV